MQGAKLSPRQAMPEFAKGSTNKSTSRFQDKRAAYHAQDTSCGRAGEVRCLAWSRPTLQQLEAAWQTSAGVRPNWRNLHLKKRKGNEDHSNDCRSSPYLTRGPKNLCRVIRGGLMDESGRFAWCLPAWLLRDVGNVGKYANIPEWAVVKNGLALTSNDMHTIFQLPTRKRIQGLFLALGMAGSIARRPLQNFTASPPKLLGQNAE